MPYYKRIEFGTDAGKRTVEGLLRLKAALDKCIPVKTLDQKLLLASWNLREFGGKKHEGREDEPLFYIAEILSRFDLISLQEVRDDLDALERLTGILGKWWRYLVSDVTQGPQGNNERLAFVYDQRKIAFGGLAGELVPPMKKTAGMLVAEVGFARTPFIAGMQAGWFKFTICANHLYYGESKADDPQRQKESETVVKLIKQRMKDHDRWANNSVLLGDFNVFSTKDKTFLALEQADFNVPAKLKGVYTNANLDKPFDQMAFFAPDMKQQMQMANAGVFPFYDYVYRDSDKAVYNPGASDKDYREWRTYKMSDHLPIWVELNIDFGAEYLAKKEKDGEKEKIITP